MHLYDKKLHVSVTIGPSSGWCRTLLWVKEHKFHLHATCRPTVALRLGSGPRRNLCELSVGKRRQLASCRRLLQILCVIFWVFPRRLIIVECRRFGTLYCK